MITQNLDLQGRGANLLTISGDHQFEVLDVYNTGTNSAFSLSVVTIANGAAAAGGAAGYLVPVTNERLKLLL